MTSLRVDTRTLGVLAVGGLAAALGFLGVLAPAVAMRLAGGIPVMNAVGIAALLLAARSVLDRYDTAITVTTLPDVLPNTTGTLAGHRLDDALKHRRATARTIIRSAVAGTVEADTDSTTATTAIDEGTWTDDRSAAAFLSRTRAVPDRLRDRVRDRFGGTPRVVRQARQTVSALLADSDIDLEDTDPGTEPATADRVIERLSEDESTTKATDRWTGVAAFPLLAVAVAVFARSPGTLLVAGVGVAIVGAVRMARESPPTPSISVERRVDDPEPAADQSVRVTLTVTNTGTDPLTDVRLCDGVPPALTVERGTPFTAAMLRPDETVTVTYAVTADHGVHTFDPAYVVVRDVAGTHEWLSRAAAEGVDTLRCVPPLSEPGPPPRHRTTPYAGRVGTKTGGQGVEFYSTREYRHGDPLARVNWKRLASTGELSTINFRRERAAAVVLLVDTRRAARVAPSHDADHAVERSVRAARLLAGGLLDEGDQVGVGTLGPTTHWTPPSAGADHRAHLRRTLAEDPAFSPRDRDGTFQASAAVTTFRTRLSEGTNVIICTPLVDDWAVSVARRLAARTAVAVVSPDPTGGATVGTRLAAAERRPRISALRSDGIRVLDWAPDDPLAAVLARQERR